MNGFSSAWLFKWTLRLCFRFKTLSTLLAGERALSSVNRHVRPNTFSSSEAHLTQFAGIRFLSSVNPHGALSVFFCVKLFPH